ncbi:hypothetical protein D3C84_364940 [compost metagenome]
MRSHRCADLGSTSVHEVEDAWRKARVVDQLCKQKGAQRRQLAWFEDYSASGGNSRGDFRGDLIKRPVPRSDETADAYGFAFNRGSTFNRLETISGQQIAGDPNVFCRERHLHCPGGANGRAHFEREGLREHFFSLKDELMDLSKDKRARLCAGSRPTGKCCKRRSNCPINILGGALRDLRNDLFSCRIDHRQTCRDCRGRPTAIDIKFVRRLRINAVAIRRLYCHLTGSLER